MATLRNIRILSITLILVGGLFLGTPAFGQTTSASRVRILLVADTNGAGADLHAFGKDRINLEKALKVALREQHLEDRYTLDVLEGGDATPAKVLEYYRNLKTETSETLFFYYSGHGGTDKTTGHFLAMSAGNLSRSELRSAMAAHHPRLLLLLTDCCANDTISSPTFPTITNADKENRLVKRPQTAQKHKHGELARQMFFTQRGVVDVNACQTGSLSFSVDHQGGHFTFALIRLLNAQVDQYEIAENGTVQWSTFFMVLRSETLLSVHSVRAPNQVPMAFAVTTEVDSRK
jgi:hypothetical protein